MKTGIEIIKEERERQIFQGGWTPEHDDQHQTGEMVAAARCYALMAETQNSGHGWNLAMVEDEIFGREEWPWDDDWWKPSDQLRNLAKAGALIAAEIDRLQRFQSNDKHRHADL